MLTDLLDATWRLFLIALLLFSSSIVIYMAIAVFFAVVNNVRRQLRNGERLQQEVEDELGSIRETRRKMKPDWRSNGDR
jgi:sensor domain CHASE-containing protein